MSSVRVIKDWEGPSVPPSFLKDLKLIHPDFDVVWGKRGQKWMIVSPAPVNVFRKGYIGEYLVQQKKKYVPLGGKVLEALRRALQREYNPDLGTVLDEIDREEEEKLKEGAKFFNEGKRGFYKWGHKLTTSKTFS